MNKLLPSLLMLCLGLLLPTVGRAACEGIASAPPADAPPGVRVVQYSSAPIQAGQQIVAQRNCFLLVNASNDVQQVRADVFLSLQGNVPGPWFVDPSQISSVDLADGVPASCSIPSPGVVRLSPAAGFLLAGTASDPCCFEWSSTNGTCEGLPLAGSQVGVQTAVGNQTFNETLQMEPPSIPSGGVTCGLIGLEALLVLPLCRGRRMRRAAAGGRS